MSESLVVWFLFGFCAAGFVFLAGYFVGRTVGR
jgi:hypothetical protein